MDSIVSTFCLYPVHCDFDERDVYGEGDDGTKSDPLDALGSSN